MPFSPAYRAEGRESRCEGCRTRGPVVVTDALIAYWTERYSAEQIRELGAAFVS